MRLLCLVPTPLQALRAARRLCDAQDGVLFGPRVLTPDDLVPGLLAASGSRKPLLTPLAERLLALESARAAGDFESVSPAGGLARALAATIAELRRAEVPAAAAAEASRELESRPGERLAAVAAALAFYESRLAGLGVLDRAAGLREAEAALRRGVCSEETGPLDLLVVEGFHAPAPAEWDLLAALAARAERTQVRLPYFPDRADLSRPAEPMLRRLEALHELAARRDLDVALAAIDPGSDRAGAIATTLRSVAGGPGAAPGPQGGRVLAVAGAGEEGEANAAARLAAEWLAEGIGAEEIAFVAASPSRTAPLLAAACAAHGVPFAGGRGARLADSAPIRAIRQALGAAPRLGRRGAEMLAASTYLELGRAPSRLAWWLERSGAIDGRNDPETALRERAARLSAAGAAAERAALQRSAAALREMRDALRPLATPGTAREFAQRLRAFIASAGVRRRAARGDRAVARRDLAALARLEEVADGLAEATALAGRSHHALSTDEYVALLDLAIDSAASSPGPEPASGAVELWSLSEAPGLAARAVVVLGCARGTFPPPPRPEPLLREPERAAVNHALGRAALVTSPARRAESLYLAFCALAAGHETVAFTWPASGPAGEGATLAPLAIEALAACGAAAPRTPPPDPPLESCRSEAEALRAGARLFRAGEGPSAIAALSAASPDLARRAASVFARGALEWERRDSVLARRPSPGAGLIPARFRTELARALPAEWSPSHLETFSNCPYQLFLSLAVGLPDRGAPDLDIDPRDEGGLAHAVLERFLRNRCERGAWPLAGNEEDKAEARAVAEQLFASFEAEGRVGDPAVWAARREAILARLDRVVEAEAREHEGLAPVLLEHGFGGNGPSPPLAFDAEGDFVLLKGRIDRVDAGPDRLLLVDYKNSRNAAEFREKLDRDTLGVTNFQLPAYLLAAARALPGRPQLEATYALLRTPERLPALQIDASHPFLAVDERRRAEIRAAGERTFVDAVIAAVRRIRSGELSIAPRDCSHCPYGAVCRFQTVAEVEP